MSVHRCFFTRTVLVVVLCSTSHCRQHAASRRLQPHPTPTSASYLVTIIKKALRIYIVCNLMRTSNFGEYVHTHVHIHMPTQHTRPWGAKTKHSSSRLHT
ncbi:hypothetical protein F4775DRAFT_558448 [Biscogniauxia sp. FL1348]|nr:hypothetical protein F4775DRAFT_558448 [Biscogniauxia sp. FL1348]